MLRFANLLSPLLNDAYVYIAARLGEALGMPAELHEAASPAELCEGGFDLAFICGLAFAREARKQDCPFEVLAAPVLWGERYAGRPVYFSDLIVRADSRYPSTSDLRGCTFAANERVSHSGYNVVLQRLVLANEAPPFFGRVAYTGSHLNSLSAVLKGEADVAAIDSHVLDVLLTRDLALASKLRVLEVLGPSPAPPLVVSRSLAAEARARLQQALLALKSAPPLEAGHIARFVKATDAEYLAMEDLVDTLSPLRGEGNRSA